MKRRPARNGAAAPAGGPPPRPRNPSTPHPRRGPPPPPTGGAGRRPRPPGRGLPYLRAASGLGLEPGAVVVRDGLIAAFEDADADAVIDAAGGARTPGCR